MVCTEGFSVHGRDGLEGPAEWESLSPYQIGDVVTFEDKCYEGADSSIFMADEFVSEDWTEVTCCFLASSITPSNIKELRAGAGLYIQSYSSGNCCSGNQATLAAYQMTVSGTDCSGVDQYEIPRNITFNSVDFYIETGEEACDVTISSNSLSISGTSGYCTTAEGVVVGAFDNVKNVNLGPRLTVADVEAGNCHNNLGLTLDSVECPACIQNILPQGLRSEWESDVLSFAPSAVEGACYNSGCWSEGDIVCISASNYDGEAIHIPGTCHHRVEWPYVYLDISGDFGGGLFGPWLPAGLVTICHGPCGMTGNAVEQAITLCIEGETTSGNVLFNPL